MASEDHVPHDILENIKRRVDQNEQRAAERALEPADRAHESAREFAQSAQAHLAELIDTNKTLPVTVSSVEVVGAPRTRFSFLAHIFKPMLENSHQGQYTITDVSRDLVACAEKLSKFDIFQDEIHMFLDKPDKSNPLTTPNDLAVFYRVQEKSRYMIKTGTDLGNAEGSAYGNVLVRNVFGGAETLSVNASLGTRTRSAYSAAFDSPILSNPNLRWELGGLGSSTTKPWASHEEVLRGAFTKLKWTTGEGHRHEVGYSGTWRQVTGLADNASPTVRADAGDSFKSSISHTWINDRRDVPLLPSRGYLMRTAIEVAGFGPLKGDVAFGKLEAETQAAVPIPIPGIKGDSGVAFTTGFKAGLLYPLTLASGDPPVQSRVNDRFQLGGPTDVRGFRISGLGPRDGPDAVGGDVYAAGSANLYFPLPRVGAEKPLRLQAFVNGGRLLALKGGTKEGKSQGMDSEDVARSVSSTLGELANGLPSLSAGVGIVYAHPVARFELNFSLPLVLRKGEEGRKGLSFGVGISFL